MNCLFWVVFGVALACLATAVYALVYALTGWTSELPLIGVLLLTIVLLTISIILQR